MSKNALLADLQEENTRVSQAISKFFVAGESSNLETSIGNFLGVLFVLFEKGHLNPDTVQKIGEAKSLQISLQILKQEKPNES